MKANFIKLQFTTNCKRITKILEYLQNDTIIHAKYGYLKNVTYWG